MFNNPELNRFIWTRFSNSRVVAVFAVLGVFGLILSLMPDPWYVDFVKPFSMIAYVSIFIWGVYNAANVFGRDIEGRTWDFQKMSPIPSWRLLWGKVFGSSCFAWFIGLVSIMVVLAALSANPDFTDYNSALQYTLIMLMSGLFGQVVAFWLGVLGQGTKVKRGGVLAFIIGAYAGFQMLEFGGTYFDTFGFEVSLSADRMHEPTLWHGIPVNALAFGYLSSLFFLFWAIVGAHQMLRERLQYNDPPIAWIGFVIAICFYAGGVFNIPTDQSFVVYSLMYVFSMMLTYVAMLWDCGNINLYRSWVFSIQKEDVAKTFEKTPKWLASMPVVVFFFIVTAFYLPEADNTGQKVLYLFSFFLFFARDAFVVHGLKIGQNSKTSHFGIWVYYLMMYVLLPWLIMVAIGLDDGFRQALDVVFDLNEDINSLDSLAFFFPIPSDHSFVMIAPITVEVIIAGLFLKNRLNRL